jgi:hypothetical protein
MCPISNFHNNVNKEPTSLSSLCPHDNLAMEAQGLNLHSVDKFLSCLLNVSLLLNIDFLLERAFTVKK